LKRHQRNREDRLLALMERVLSVQEQTLATQKLLLQIWSTVPGAADTNAVDFRSFEEDYLLNNLRKAAEFEDPEAKEILEDPARIEAYLAQFR
jgi:hypothetical protein